MAPKGYATVKNEVERMIGRPVAASPGGRVGQVAGGRRRVLAKQSSITSKLT